MAPGAINIPANTRLRIRCWLNNKQFNRALAAANCMNPIAAHNTSKKYSVASDISFYRKTEVLAAIPEKNGLPFLVGKVIGPRNSNANI